MSRVVVRLQGVKCVGFEAVDELGVAGACRFSTD